MSLSLKRQDYLSKKPKTILAMTPIQRQQKIDVSSDFREEDVNVFIPDES